MYETCLKGDLLSPCAFYSPIIEALLSLKLFVCFNGCNRIRLRPNGSNRAGGVIALNFGLKFRANLGGLTNSFPKIIQFGAPDLTLSYNLDTMYIG
jgi:hypothetical protein